MFRWNNGCLGSQTDTIIEPRVPRNLLSGRVFLLSLFAAAALSLGTVQPVFAFSLFGITLFEDENEAAANAVIADPRNYGVDVSVSGQGDLLDSVRNASALWNGREAPASGAAGLLATARADYRRIQTALYDAGYYGGSISIRVAGKEAADLAPDATLADPIAVKITVDTGPLFHFGAAQIVNPAAATAHRKKRDAARRHRLCQRPAGARRCGAAGRLAGGQGLAPAWLSQGENFGPQCYRRPQDQHA